MKYDMYKMHVYATLQNACDLESVSIDYLVASLEQETQLISKTYLCDCRFHSPFVRFQSEFYSQL